MDNSVVESLKKHIKSRLVSHVYGIFILSWLAFHWQAIYITFFVSEANILRKTGLLKNEYLVRILLDFKDPAFYVQNIGPFVVTWLVIWYLPKLVEIPAFKKDKFYEVEKHKIAIENEQIIEEAQLQLEEIRVKKLGKESEKVSIERKIEKSDPTILWENEYKQFKETNTHNLFYLLVESIYEHAGKTRDDFSQIMNEWQFEVPSEILVYAHTNDLITLDKNKEKIELTEKGKHFVKLYSLDRMAKKKSNTR